MPFLGESRKLPLGRPLKSLLQSLRKLPLGRPLQSLLQLLCKLPLVRPPQLWLQLPLGRPLQALLLSHLERSSHLWGLLAFPPETGCSDVRMIGSRVARPLVSTLPLSWPATLLGPAFALVSLARPRPGVARHPGVPRQRPPQPTTTGPARLPILAVAWQARRTLGPLSLGGLAGQTLVLSGGGAPSFRPPAAALLSLPSRLWHVWRLWEIGSSQGSATRQRS